MIEVTYLTPGGDKATAIVGGTNIKHARSHVSITRGGVCLEAEHLQFVTLKQLLTELVENDYTAPGEHSLCYHAMNNCTHFEYRKFKELMGKWPDARGIIYPVEGTSVLYLKAQRAGVLWVDYRRRNLVTWLLEQL